MGICFVMPSNRSGRNRKRQSVHLPDIPCNNIRRMFQLRQRRIFLKFIPHMFRKRIQDILTGDQKTVSLPLKSIYAFQRTERPPQPVFFLIRMLTHDTQFSIQKPDAFRHLNLSAGLHIVSAGQIRSFPTGDLHSFCIHIIPPATLFLLRKDHFPKGCRPGFSCYMVKYFRYAKPCAVQIIVLPVADPSGSGNLCFCLCPADLVLFSLCNAGQNHFCMLPRDQINRDRAFCAVCRTKLFIVVRCPYNMCFGCFIQKQTV